MTTGKKLISIITALALLFTTLQFTTSEVQAATYTGKYWLKVNTQQNVVTAYQKVSGKWKPIRAMLCSTGLNGTTPLGTFYTQGKWNWGELINDVYGQYCTHITGDILFHSVYYLKRYDKSSQVTSQFNKLGSSASHGCVRLSVADAKWIYYTCGTGTKVTIYRSKNPGPLGKPAGTKVSTSRYQYWDPTDPDPDNPYYIVRKPVITVSSKKSLTVQYGRTDYNLKAYVYAKDPNTFMNLKTRLKVSKVQRYSSAKGKYVTAKFSTKTLGTYKVTYSVKAPYGKTAYKTIKIKVVDNLKAPTISGAKNRTVTWGDKNAVSGVTAKQATGSRTTSIKVHIKAPGASKYAVYSYAAAKNYRFAKTGKYSVKYVVKNKYAPYKQASKTVTVTSKKGAVNRDPVLTIPESLTDRTVTSGAAVSDLFTGITAVHNGKDVTGNIKISVLPPDATQPISLTQAAAKKYVFDREGVYYIEYSVKNRYTPYQTVKKTVRVEVKSNLGEEASPDPSDS